MKYAKVIIVTLFCIGFVLGSVSLTFGQGGAPPYAGLNYEKIALLKWYAASQNGWSTKVGHTAEAIGIAFDGANIWATNYTSNTLTKLRAADCAVLGEISVGPNPIGLAFDGANIWVTNSNEAGGGGTVTKVRASDSAVLGTFNVGLHP